MKKYTELQPVKLDPPEFDHIEARIKRVFKELVYGPLLRELGIHGRRKILKNSKVSPLASAIESGQISYSGAGVFKGKFSAEVSRELKRLGATWNRKNKSFTLHPSKIPPSLTESLLMADIGFRRKVEKAASKLTQNLPAKITGRLKTADLFSSAVSKTDRQLRQTFAKAKEAVSVAPDLSPERRKRIAEEWQTNLNRYIKDFADEEIIELREKVEAVVFKGARQDELRKLIEKSYGATARKAKFLARQETNLLLTKFKEVRYTEAGLQEYKWGCVAGTKDHPVRKSHKKLEGKIFRWDTPPITTPDGEPERRNNPGEDYNCRCFAIPVVRKK